MSIPNYLRGINIDMCYSLLTNLSDAALSMALVSTHTIPRLLDLLSVGKLETAALMVTHDFKFDEIEKAYDVFNRAAETNALKVNIEFS